MVVRKEYSMQVDILIGVAEKGGVENIIKMLVPYLEKQRGWNVRVVQLVWEGVRWTDEETQYYPLLFGKDGHDLNEFVETYASFIRENGVPDIILATAWPYMCYVAKKALAMNGNFTKKVISWLHAPLERYQESGFGGYEHLALANAHFAISKTIYDGIKRALPDSLVYMARNPVDFDKCVKVKNHDEECREGLNLFFVGRVSKEKRLECIVNAISVNAGACSLYIIGSGDKEYENQIRILIEKKGLAEYVHWLGWKENPWEHVQDADAIILASEYEGFPLVAIEALANGIPVISTPVSGIVELIKPGVNGYLYPTDDWQTLAKVLNMISTGMFSKCDKTICQTSVQKFEKDRALGDFAAKMEEIVKGGQNDGALELYAGDKISVIVPAYNVEKYVEECIESLLNQTIPLDMLELIFIDDASKDGTLSLIQNYEQQYPDIITLIACEENVGLGAVRNIGMTYATGEYIAFIDSDDKVNSNMLQMMYEKMKISNCDIVGCGYRLFNDIGLSRDFGSDEKRYNMHSVENKRRYIIEHGCKNSVCRHMYRKALLDDNNIFFPEGTYMEDYYFHVLTMMHAQACYEMKDILYLYRENSNGIMRTLNKEHLLDIVKVQNMTYAELARRGLNVGFEEELAVLYYVKAFVEPISNMEKGKNGIEWDYEIVEELKGNILDCFPNILQNAYINQDVSEENMKYLDLLSE